VRHTLVGKHKDIINLILSNHAGYCKENIAYLEMEFKNVIKALSKKPENIEELCELQDYMSGLNNTLVTSLLMSSLSLLPGHDILVDLSVASFSFLSLTESTNLWVTIICWTNTSSKRISRTV